ncbi:MAG: hypothetical protein LUD83_00120 [Clostridiales bacterium]|nr:hypothetical protein [Clostridiales bacterium]
MEKPVENVQKCGNRRITIFSESPGGGLVSFKLDGLFDGKCHKRSNAGRISGGVIKVRENRLLATKEDVEADMKKETKPRSYWP